MTSDPRTILQIAATYIPENWVAGHLATLDGRVCALGAVSVAVVNDFNDVGKLSADAFDEIDGRSYSLIRENEAAEQAVFLLAYVMAKRLEADGDCPNPLGDIVREYDMDTGEFYDSPEGERYPPHADLDVVIEYNDKEDRKREEVESAFREAIGLLDSNFGEDPSKPAVEILSEALAFLAESSENWTHGNLVLTPTMVESRRSVGIATKDVGACCALGSVVVVRYPSLTPEDIYYEGYALLDDGNGAQEAVTLLARAALVLRPNLTLTKVEHDPVRIVYLYNDASTYQEVLTAFRVAVALAEAGA